MGNDGDLKERSIQGLYKPNQNIPSKGLFYVMDMTMLSMLSKFLRLKIPYRQHGLLPT